MPALTVGDGVDLHYEDHGDGRPVVLAHGWPLSGRSWERQLGPLVAAGYRVIAYDRRGFGRSAQPWHGYDPDTLAADLHRLLTGLDLADVTLVGSGMGGGEVVRCLTRHGAARVSGLVLASSLTPYLRRGYDNPGGAWDDRVIADLEAGARADRLAAVDDYLRRAFGGHLGAAEHAYHRDIAAGASPKGTADCVDVSARTDHRTDLAAVTVPTLVLHGSADAIAPLEATGRPTHALLPSGSLVVLDGAPHAANLTHPEAFNRALLGFLAT